MSRIRCVLFGHRYIAYLFWDAVYPSWVLRCDCCGKWEWLEIGAKETV